MSDAPNKSCLAAGRSTGSIHNLNFNLAFGGGSHSWGRRHSNVANIVKTILITIIVACSVLVTACNKKSSTASMVETKAAYSHPNRALGGFEMTRCQELGTITRMTPNTGQRLGLTDNKTVSFSQRTDSSGRSKIRVTVESEMEGFPPKTQVLEFDSSAPYPQAAKYKNGLMASTIEEAANGGRLMSFT